MLGLIILLKLPNSVEFTLGVDRAISHVRAQMPSLDNSKIFLGGHGLGGAVAQLNLGFAGYVVWGVSGRS
jgi:D-aminopeptidase